MRGSSGSGTKGSAGNNNYSRCGKTDKALFLFLFFYWTRKAASSDILVRRKSRV